MKRSYINEIVASAEAFAGDSGFHLPKFAFWSPEEWRLRASEVEQVIDRGLGWDITDFGIGNFKERGLVLFTMRNGHPDNLQSGTGQTYAEKMLVVDVDQVTPLHFHWVKTEDIINRGGGLLAVQLYQATENDQLDTAEVVVRVDGMSRRVRAGETVVLEPGESITLTPRLYHAFWGVGQRVLVGEVSSVNDDAHDNRFYEPIGRFPVIEKDAEPRRLLVGDYASYLS